MMRRIVTIAIAVCLLTSCRDVDKIRDEIEAIRNAMVAQSELWQKLLKELEEDLTDKKEKILAEQVDSLLQTGITTLGAEFQCNVDFVADRMVSGLDRIKAGVVPFSFFHHQPAPVPPSDPYFCHATPIDIDLAKDPSVRRRLLVTGFNLRLADIEVYVVDDKGVRREIPHDQNQIAILGGKTLDVNISDGNGVVLSDTDRQLQFQLAGHPPHAVNILSKTRHFSVSTDPPVGLEVNGSEAGGEQFVDECKRNEVATGLMLRAGGSIDQIALECSPLVSDGTLGVAYTTPNRGGTGGDPRAAPCAAGTVLVGLTADEETNYRRVSRLSGQCQSIAAVSALDGANKTVIGTLPAGGWNGTTRLAACPQGDVLTGITGRAGTPAPGAGGAGGVVKHLGFLCRQLIAQRQ